MKNLSIVLASTLVLGLASACSSELNEEDQATLDARVAEENKLPATLAEIAANEADLSTFNAAMGLTALPTLPEAQEGPFTMFAPTNDAFAKLGTEKSNELMSAEQKETLTGILGFHTLKGVMSAADLTKAITDGGGTATLTSMQGGELKASMDGENIVIEDSAGNKATVVQAGLESDNGLIHKVDTVLMPG